MTKLPHVSKSVQQKHTGESAAIVDGKFVAFGKNTTDVVVKAEKKGYRLENMTIAHIMGKKNYAL
jgi:hypothetical protein